MGTTNHNNPPCFTPKEMSQLYTLASLYMQTKALILYSEEIDPDFRSNLQTIKEMRDTLDHLLRIIHERFHNYDASIAISQASCDYFQQNIHKSIGHLYRAAFDALDGTVLSLREKIITVLDDFPVDAVNDILPEYWEMRIKLNTLNNSIAEHRAKKDIGGNIAETYNCFVSDVEQLKYFYNKLLAAGETLSARQQKKQQEEKKSITIQVVIGIFCTLLGIAVGVALNSCSSDANNSKVQIEQPKTAP